MKASKLLLVVTLILSACAESERIESNNQVVVKTIEQPNILLIVADDLGFTDISPFGSEIHTPNLQALADNGLMLNHFYASMTCSPSRAMLMSGIDSHRAGLGNMIETTATNQEGKPGYEGYLSKRVLSLAELLKEAGYHTYMAGKWHLGNQHDQSPRARGFERSFSFLYGGGSHFDDMIGPDEHRPHLFYREDGELIDSLPEGFYSTQNYTDKMLEYIGSQIDDGQPFFGYLSYTAPHWPLQIPEGERDSYRGKYDEGYEVFRERRFERMKSKGLVMEDMELPSLPKSIPAWASLTDEEKQIQSGDMEIYAAMIDYMDRSIGRITDYLKNKGAYDNTLIVFMSDNGPEAWGNNSAPPEIEDYAKTFDNSLDNRGKKGSFVFYGPGWANVGSLFLRQHKGSVANGGIRVPAILSWPRAKAKGKIIQHVLSVKDVLPTVLDMAGIEHPGSQFQGREIELPQGYSMLPLLDGSAESVRPSDSILGTELWGSRSVLVGDWKSLHMVPPLGTGEWELFNLKNDPSEQIDLAKVEPEQLEIMIAAWEKYEADNMVIMPEGPLVIRKPEPVFK